MAKSWSVEDIEFLTEYYPEEGAELCADVLDRSADAVRLKASRLNIPSNTKSIRWTAEEDSVLLNYYISEGMSYCRNRLNRSIKSIEHRLGRLDLRPSSLNYWTEEEIAILVDNYSKGPTHCASLINRPLVSIKCKATALGLIFQSKWEKSEIQFLTEHYPRGGLDICLNNLNRTKSSILGKVHSLGLKITGPPLEEEKEDLIISLRNFYLRKGRSPSGTDCGVFENLPTPKVYTRVFGSWKDGLEAAGLPIVDNMTSNLEKEVVESIKSFYFGEIVLNSRPLEGKEIDILLPELNIGIEFDGLYWHSETRGKDSKYHLNKTNLAADKGIRLIHIFENEWLYKQDIVVSRIKNMLNLSTNSLVGLMTFSKSRFSTKYEYELVRYCSKLNTAITGGASKLFKYFKRNYSPESIVSYADLRWNTGNLYEKLGFNFSHGSQPNYWYTKGSKLESRVKYQKHKLAGLLDSFSSELTEYENMQNNGYHRIYDCGSKVFIWEQ